MQPALATLARLVTLLTLATYAHAWQCGPTTEFPALVVEADYTSPSAKLAGGAPGYHRLNLYRPDPAQHPGPRPVLVELNMLEAQADPTFGKSAWLASKLTGKKDAFSGRFLCGGYAVVRARIGFDRGQDCDADVPVKGRGLFVPPGDPQTDAAYFDLERPMAERDVVMVVQYIRDKALTGDPSWRDLDLDRIVIVAQSYVAIGAAWAALGPDRGEEIFGARRAPGVLQSTQERRSTRVWAFICRRALLWLPGQDMTVSPMPHWPQEAPCDVNVGLDRRALLIDDPIFPPGLATWASALHFSAGLEPPHVFLYYEVPNVQPVEPNAPITTAFGTELAHSVWDGLAWKAENPVTSKLVVGNAAVPVGLEWATGGWYDEVVDPLNPSEETGLAFDWLEELRSVGQPTLVNLGGGVQVDIDPDSFLPHFWGTWDGGQLDFELTGAPAAHSAEVWRDDGVSTTLVHSFTTLQGSTTGSFTDNPVTSVTYQVKVLTTPLVAASNRIVLNP